MENKKRNTKRLSTEQFIEKAREIHGDKYDYSKVNYVNNKTKVCIVCPEHGEFWQKPIKHITQKQGCPYCAGKYITTDGFIQRAKLIHGDKYDYSKVEYKGTHTKVCIICPEHGEFWMTPHCHYSGKPQGCPKCGKEKTQIYNENKRLKCANTFVSRANKIHNNKYDYSKSKYITTQKHIIIICPIHGEFLQTPDHHLCGSGCPYCNQSHLERDIEIFLQKNNIKYIQQKMFDWLGKQRLDFYLPEYNIAIECQGQQHYIPVDFGSEGDDAGIKKLEETTERDIRKYKLCMQHGIKLYYYTDYEGVNESNIIFKNKNSLLEHINIVNDIYNNIKKYDNNIILEDKNTILVENLKYKIKFVRLTLIEQNQLLLEKNENIKCGYKTIFIFENEYVNNKEIVMNKLYHILNINNNNMIKTSARDKNVVIKEIDNTIAEIFLKNNHIQGYVGSSIHIGAYYKEVLIAVMSFTLEDKNKLKWNLTRFASDNKIICQGIGGKLFKYFIRNYEYKEVKSFADRRWTINEDDNLYIKLGFKLDKILSSDYRYITNDGELKHKFGFRKQILHKKYGLSLTMTEKEMCDELGFYRVWDCGLLKYVYKNELLE